MPIITIQYGVTGQPQEVDVWSALGVIPLDSFPGSSDVAKWDSALTYIGAQTYKPTLVLSNDSYDLRTATAKVMPKGFRWSGPLGGKGVEFGNTNRVLCPTNGLFAVGPTKDFKISGISLESTTNGKFLVPSSPSGSEGKWEDFELTGCSLKGFGPDFIKGAVTRCHWHEWYVNSGTNTSMSIGGTDSALWTNGQSFMSSAGNDANTFLIDTGALANSRIGHNFLTPQGGGGINIPNPRQGLIVEGGFRMTSTGRTGDLRTQRAGIRVGASGGDGAVFNDVLIFAVNCAGIDPGDITVLGDPAQGHGGHVFNNPQFWHHAGSYVAPNLVGITAETPPADVPPAIYTTVPIVVNNPISNGGRPKVLREATPGLITCNDPSWTVVTAP